VCYFLWSKGGSSVSGLILNYSESDEERHELRLMITGNISTKQASDWLLAFQKVITPFRNCAFWFLKWVPARVWWCCAAEVKKAKFSPYSLPSIGLGADPGVQVVSPQVTWSESRHGHGSRQKAAITFSHAWSYFHSFYQIVPPIAHIWFQLITYLLTREGWKAELAWLADL